MRSKVGSAFRTSQEENIKIIKNAEVTEILTENDIVKSIEINNSEIINCDYIICNSDPPNVYKNLIKSKNNYNFLFKQKMKRMDYSMGLFVYYFGSKKKYNNVAHHTIYFGKSYEKHLNKIYTKEFCISPLKSLSLHLTNVNSSYGLSPFINYKKLWDENK